MQKREKQIGAGMSVVMTGWGRVVLILFIPVWLAACTTGPTMHTSLQHSSINLNPGDLQHGGIAFITPSSITGREEDRQSLALSFVSVLISEHKDIRVVTLAETLSAINRANMTAEYNDMFNEYQETGIFQQHTLRKIGEVTGVRYLAQLKLAGFYQQSAGRFGVLGLRLVETKRTNLRVFLQIWDSQEGSIVWEGLEELTLSTDTFSEKIISFNDIARQSARELLEHIPYQKNRALVPVDEAKKSSDIDWEF
ncbi:hypothetical protein MNBD_GAMMA25-1093 [hydrothermal vent metagenome]|uniref:Lipoprotein n=1 Tax=hydrothermal vent metagenome TaxID=652676 RepID=A0A3B1APN4_9ZZZZ